MAEYTKKGLRLERQGLTFSCLGRWVGWTQETSFQKSADLFLARLTVLAPCTEVELRRQVRAWLSAYEDEELLERGERAIDEALAAMPDLPQGTPSVPPQKGQLN